MYTGGECAIIKAILTMVEDGIPWDNALPVVIGEDVPANTELEIMAMVVAHSSDPVRVCNAKIRMKEILDACW